MTTPIAYQAPPPPMTPKATAKVAAAIVIFPIGLIWGMQKVARYTATIFITSYYKHHPEILERRYEALRHFYPEYLQKKIYSHDGVAINFLHFPSKNPHSKKMIFVAPGLGNEAANMAYSWKENWKHSFDDAHVVFVDPRGVGRSKGHMDIKKGADDLYSVAQHFIQKKGISPSACVNWGYSLGGGTAARAAKLLQRTYPKEKIPLVHQNSFRKFTAAVENLLGSWFGFCFKIGLSMIDQELTPETDTKRLKGKTIVIYNTNDEIILHDAVYHPEGPSYQVFPVQGDRRSYERAHMRPLSEREKRPIAQAIHALWV